MYVICKGVTNESVDIDMFEENLIFAISADSV